MTFYLGYNKYKQTKKKEASTAEYKLTENDSTMRLSQFQANECYTTISSRLNNDNS